MLERMASNDAEPCMACIGLVGAAPRVAPHQGLMRSAIEDTGTYICLKCGVLWRLGHLGWARVVRAAERATRED